MPRSWRNSGSAGKLEQLDKDLTAAIHKAPALRTMSCAQWFRKAAAQGEPHAIDAMKKIQAEAAPIRIPD